MIIYGTFGMFIRDMNKVSVMLGLKCDLGDDIIETYL